jgi:RNA polymerase sigma-70 factor, ECF subfamily
MRKASLGDDRAFSELHALTIHKMRKTALSVSSVSADIEDVLQDAYLKIWRHAPRFDPDRASPISWMTTIVRNTAIDAVRPVRIATTDIEHVSIADAADQTDDDFDYGRARPIAAETIGRLPDDRQRLLSLAYLEGESRMALAERFGVPVGTIKTWLRRTLESVKADCLLAQPREALLAAA